jgi:hypothetical protein
MNNVHAEKETPSGFETISFTSDKTGAINTSLTLQEIEIVLKQVSQYIQHRVYQRNPLSTQSYIQAVFRTDDAEQLWLTMNMLVDKGIINFNPVTRAGLIFGQEHHDQWYEFGGRIYPYHASREWSLSTGGEERRYGRFIIIPYIF